MREITPINNNGSIMLRFSVKGKRYAMTPITGGRYDDPDDLKASIAVALIISGDLRTGNFDPTLEKYGGNLKTIQKRIDQTQEDLKELRQKQAHQDLSLIWQKYRDFKAPTIAPSTLKIDFDRRVGNCLKDLPTTALNEAVTIRDWLIQNKPQPQAKKILTQLSACCDWAVESLLIEINPFERMSARLKTKSQESEINPFTAEERDRLIKAFEGNHYQALVRFLFAVGCRPNEAVALRWSDIKGNQLTFQRGYVEGQEKSGLKTQKRRTINLNSSVKEILAGIPQTGERVFSSPEGNLIDWHNFSNRDWRGALGKLPDIEYRPPYQMRHSFITLALAAGVKVADIAKFCGNSATTIYKRYAGITRGFTMPDL